MKTAWVVVAWLVAGAAGGCSHSYARLVVVAIQTDAETSEDVAWVVEDGRRIVRCENGPDRPICRRARVY